MHRKHNRIRRQRRKVVRLRAQVQHTTQAKRPITKRTQDKAVQE